MKKFISLIILFSLLSSLSWATLTANKIPVTKTSGSTPALQDGDITDVVGTSVTSGVVTYVPQLCLNNVCETAWPSGGSQTTGSNLLFGNGSGGYTNVTGSSTNGSFITIASNALNSTGINWTTIDNYNTSTSAFTQTANIKVSYGTATTSNSGQTTTISNLPFTSTGTYTVTASFNGNSTDVCAPNKINGNSFYLIATTNNDTCNWVALGY